MTEKYFKLIYQDDVLISVSEISHRVLKFESDYKAQREARDNGLKAWNRSSNVFFNNKETGFVHIYVKNREALPVEKRLDILRFEEKQLKKYFKERGFKW